ncbi:hypothetical protein DPSP01_005521 [Paraphaeosphaeria sporulosa]|uniref:Uncharacterized protein n=1 Tax=Paraphaeosphaeria sporulosa TaxID=1460663 RepID=A0A177CSS3_9PLEO|nr:uncharacterized protein CC84DRAFT_1213894 [Paraphaeosphaeria sporulosa]OAG10583.1 hypothetical protein CC84DRAFT_1213894 [Paraphaeosphaeria sporulosa]
MHYIIPSLFLSTAAAQAVGSLPSLSILKLPQIPVLPLQGVPDVLAGNGYNSIADSLSKAAQSIGAHTDLTTVANAKLTGDISVNPTPNIPTTFDLVKSVGGASATLWQLAYDLENKVCSIATSINQQNIAAQQSNLAVAIQAQVDALTKLQQTLNTTVITVQTQAVAFSDAEKSILTSAILALVGSVVASAAPIQALATGLANVGITSISSVAGILTAQANALAAFASKVNFVGL